jgi:DNA-binding PadR family transcriptional regulator
MKSRRVARTPAAVAVLQLLSEQAMHPYELQRLIRDRYLDRIVKLRSGSLYHTVERLARHGLIQAVDTERQGRRPERTVYRLTPEGAETLEAWLRDLLGTPEWPEYPLFAVGLAFLTSLDPEGVRRELERRKVEVEVLIASYEAVERHAGRGRTELIPHEYLQALRKAELEWIDKTVAELRGGSLRWEGR